MTFAVGEFLELSDLGRVERKLLQLLQGLTEILPHAAIVLDELRILKDQVLTHDPLERNCLLVELPARASRLRCLQYRLLALRAEPIEAHDQLDQCVQERQTDQQETEQDKLEK